MEYQITRPFKATFWMTYPFLNNDTKFFLDWAGSTTFETLENATYWQNDWGLTNSSYGAADAFSSVYHEELGYEYLSDAIDQAFIDDICINYRYSNESATNTYSSKYGYYQKCAPYQCVWFTAERKSFFEIVIIIFGLLGGIHAALFVVGIGHNIHVIEMLYSFKTTL